MKLGEVFLAVDIFQLGVLHIGFEALRVISVDTNADRVTTVTTAPLRLDLMNSLGGGVAGHYVTAMRRRRRRRPEGG